MSIADTLLFTAPHASHKHVPSALIPVSVNCHRAYFDVCGVTPPPILYRGSPSGFEDSYCNPPERIASDIAGPPEGKKMGL